MAKKTFGIDTLIQSTTIDKNKNISNYEQEKTVGLYINIPVSLKKKLDVYCAEHGIKKQNFLIQEIENKLKNYD